MHYSKKATLKFILNANKRHKQAEFGYFLFQNDIQALTECFSKEIIASTEIESIIPVSFPSYIVNAS